MKYLLPILTAALLISGCITEKKRQRICDACPVKITKKDSIAYVHDTVPVFMPGKQGPTVYLDNPCKHLCDSAGNLKKINITQTKNGQTVNINTMGGGLHISSETKDTTLKAPVLKKETYSDTLNETVKYMPCEYERTIWDGVFKIGFFIQLLILGLLALKKRFWP